MRRLSGLQKKVCGLFFLLLTLSFLTGIVSTVNAAGYLPHIWPLSGTTTPDLPMSSVFGPRLKASENFIYDFHRGIDIPTPLGTPVHAVADGVVRLAGNYSSYSDTLVQIRHYKPGSGPMTCANRGCYYSNSMHLSSVAVSAGANVSQGAIIGYTGASESGFAHLHLEIRDNGIYQKNCINPWKAMPYQDTLNLSISFAGDPDFSNTLSPEVEAEVSSPSNELDFNRVKVEVFDISSGSEVSLASQSYDIELWNYIYTPENNPDQYLTNPDFNGIEVGPAVFNAREEAYLVQFRFHELHLPYTPQQARVRISAFDIKENSVEASLDITL
ncbi:MAG: M23 family metallopeptidase [Nitrospirae bacterium]|nr:M23 family metallopeptidase [Nitrospirota bacterium]